MLFQQERSILEHRPSRVLPLPNIITRTYEPFNFGCSVSGQKEVLDLQLLWQEEQLFFSNTANKGSTTTGKKSQI